MVLGKEEKWIYMYKLSLGWHRTETWQRLVLYFTSGRTKCIAERGKEEVYFGERTKRSAPGSLWVKDINMVMQCSLFGKAFCK